MKAPMVSVGMPVYNSAPWLEEAIKSVLDQSLSDLELIVCDNASTDDSGRIVERLAKQDGRIRYHRHQRNIGANRNYQSTLDLATGRYFKWASSSDLCAPTFLADSVAVLEARPDVVLATGCTMMFSNRLEDGTRYEQDFGLTSDDPKDRYSQIVSMMKLNNVFNGVMRTAAVKAVGPLGVFERADNVLMAKLALLGKFILLEQPLYYRRMTLETATKLQSELEKHVHMEPGVKKPLLWQNWRFYLALLNGVLLSALSIGTRLRVATFTLRQAVSARRELAEELQQALRRLSESPDSGKSA